MIVSPRQTTGIVLLLLLASGLSGCVRRRMTIRSNPPGALVYVDNYEIGTTPCSTDFIYYGTRDIRLEKDGYETLHVKQNFRRPWYQYPVAEFFAETMIPGELRDEHALNYQLSPQVVVPTDRLIARAEELRRGVHSAPVPGSLPGNPTPALVPRAEPLPVPRATGPSVQTLPPGGRVFGQPALPSPTIAPSGPQLVIPGQPPARSVPYVPPRY